VTACPTGLVSYTGRPAAKAGGRAEAAALGRDCLTPMTWRCGEGCGGVHYRLLTPAEVEVKQAVSRGEAPPEADLARRPEGDVPGVYQACPGCGAGWGQPHYERCGIALPDYSRPITALEAKVITMFAISIFPLDLVRRNTIRAMLPRGDDLPRSGQKNRVSRWFAEALTWADEYGYIERRHDHILVLHRQALVAYSGRRMGEIPGLTEEVWLAIARVTATLPAEPTTEGKADRARELAALRHLMESAPGTGPHGGRGYARIVPRPGRP
jgi:hypothetical protein